MMRWFLLFLLLPGLAWSADFPDPTWPCIQRKVPHLSVGQMWVGPEVTDQHLSAWRKDTSVAALAPALAVRRTSNEEATALINELSDRLGEDRTETLTRLFAGTFALIERERSQIISGIARYAKTQTALTQAIEDSQNKLTKMLAIENPDFDTQDQIEELEDKIQWDTRIYKDRQQSLSFVCETPVILERRAFAMARAIMEKLD